MIESIVVLGGGSAANTRNARAMIRCIPFGVALSIFCGCHKSPSVPNSRSEALPAPWFDDITERSGLNFMHDVGPVGNYFMPESVGSGLALIDYDNDGRLDLYFVQNAGADAASRNQLFHQQADGRFADVSAGSGLDVAGRGMGVAVGDVNNDGWSDVLVTEFTTVRLFLNETNGHFREVTGDSGLDNPFWAVSAAFFDFDRDGWLDIVVANYVPYDPGRHCVDERGQPEFCGPKTFPPGSISKLFRNRGEERRAPERPDGQAPTRVPMFEDVTARSGLGTAPGPALAVACADFDGDGWADIFIANDGEANRLWINRHDGTFKDEAITRGLAFNGMGAAQGNMGIALADVNGDNECDLFVTHLIEETHALWLQGPRGLFQDRTAALGMARPRWHGTGFGTVAEDFNNDGAPDVAIVNGAVRRNKLNQPDARTISAVGAFWAPYAERNQLFVNDGKGVFRDVSQENDPFCGTARVARGLAAGDLDNDGAIDLVVSNIGNPARIYRNVVPQRGHWLLVRAIDPALGGRDAYGAQVTVEAMSRRWSRWCNPGSSYASSNDPRAHFGLGKVDRVDGIEVLWPDGIAEKFPASAVDRMITLRKGAGKLIAP